MIRSLLYVPASAPRFVEKAHLRGADAIILDLEDAVAEGKKAAAREGLPSAVAAVGRVGAKVYVRINSEPDRSHLDGVAALRSGACGLVMPKVRDAESLSEMIGRLREEVSIKPIDIVALIEDAKGLVEARAIAAIPGVSALALGGEDFAAATGAEPTPEVLRLPKLLVHYAAKAAGRRSYGLLRSVTDYADAQALDAAAAEARAFGFDGATCIHPSAVAVLNRRFGPTDAEIEWARRVVEAGAKGEMEGAGAFLLEGEFIDRPIIRRAQSILETIEGADR